MPDERDTSIPHIRPTASNGRSPGPGSIMWETFSDLTLAPFSIPILVMQAAHPDVGAAVAKYSIYREEPWGRLFRTGFSLMRFLYGGKDGSMGKREAGDLRALHSHINGVRDDGTPYRALTPSTFRVVPDTFLAGVIRFRETVGESLGELEKEQLFQEYIELCAMFGIKRDVLENSLDEFVRYFDDLLLNTMNYNETVAFLLGEMMKYGPRMKYVPLPQPWCQAIYHRTLYPLIRIFTLGFLDPRFRAKHGIEWSERDQAQYEFWVKIAKVIRKIVPRVIRYNPFALYVILGGRGCKLVSPERFERHARK